MLENKLNITNEVELAKEEERITKLKALELFDTNKINEFEVGTTKGLCDILKNIDAKKINKRRILTKFLFINFYLMKFIHLQVK